MGQEPAAVSSMHPDTGGLSQQGLASQPVELSLRDWADPATGSQVLACPSSMMTAVFHCLWLLHSVTAYHGPAGMRLSLVLMQLRTDCFACTMQAPGAQHAAPPDSRQADGDMPATRQSPVKQHQKRHWECKLCTYAGNSLQWLRCEVCDSLRGSSLPSSQHITDQHEAMARTRPAADVFREGTKAEQADQQCNRMVDQAAAASAGGALQNSHDMQVSDACFMDASTTGQNDGSAENESSRDSESWGQHNGIGARQKSRLLGVHRGSSRAGAVQKRQGRGRGGKGADGQRASHNTLEAFMKRTQK